jgi:hypothetical protein
MIYKNLKKSMIYDGGQIKPLWAFREMGIKESSIITWIGPMEIKPAKIIDYEDVDMEIKADKMIHFIVEHLDCQPADMRLCYHRQRILVIIVKEVLGNFGIKTKRNGDDLFVGARKLTVSIATCSISSMKIHLGINLTSKGTPEDVPTVGILEIGNALNYDNINVFMDSVCKNYIKELSSIEEDIAKTRVF